MDKRLKEHIDELIRLYDEARTTDEQERELADFFSQPHDTLPEEWERYAALFTAFAGSESLFSEAELEELLDVINEVLEQLLKDGSIAKWEKEYNDLYSTVEE